MINNINQTYVFWHRDPNAYAVIAFMISWYDFYSYSIPPLTMILKSLRKNTYIFLRHQHHGGFTVAYAAVVPAIYKSFNFTTLTIQGKDN